MTDLRQQAIIATGLVGTAEALKAHSPSLAKSLLIYAMSKGSAGAAYAMESLCSTDAERVAWHDAGSVYQHDIDPSGETRFYPQPNDEGEFRMHEILRQEMDCHFRDRVRELTKEYIGIIEYCD